MQDENIGYEVGKWYLVEIGYQISIPAKFIGIRRGCNFKSPFHDFPHPEQAIFENVKLYKCCGFDGDKWKRGEGHGLGASIGEYVDFKPKFRPVTENELWAVEAIEEFQKIITGQKQSFSITMSNGWKLEGKVKPPGKKDNLPGKYYAHLANKKTGEERGGFFDYDGKSESARAFLNSKLPPEVWHLHTLKFSGESFGLKQESE